MRKLKYVKLFENFQVNESIQDDVDHIIKYSEYTGGELYAGQNMNIQQSITQNEYPNQRNYRKDLAPGKLISQSNIEYQYLIANDQTLSCYNPSFSDDQNGEFLGSFNRRFKKNYKILIKRDKNGSVLSEYKS
jgi:hypothetical protein